MKPNNRLKTGLVFWGGKKKSTETNSKITYVWELVDRDFMPAVTTLLGDVKENMLVMNKKIENMSKGIETIKLNQM